jgi:beta-galactosidase GanA
MKNKRYLSSMNITDQFVYGTQYYRAPTPLPDEWDYDLAKMGKAGLHTIQIRVQWRWNERREGEYIFDDIDRLFDLAEQHNKQVIFKFMLETAPDYIFKKYDGMRQDMHGKPIRPGGHGAFYVGGWWPCFDNPHVLSKAQEFVEVFTQRYKNRKSLLLWNIWNEPRMRPIGDCGCLHSINNYRQWLRDEYGTIENLNAHFGKCWEAFDTIDAPGMPYDYVELFLWRKWARRSLSNRLAKFYKVVKALDPHRPVISHVGVSSVQQDAAGDVSDDVLNSGEVDFYGTSFGVMNIFSDLIEESTPFLICDWLRTVSEYFWVYELYPDWGKWNPPAGVYDYKLRTWAAIAGGSKGILFWQYRAERVGSESNLSGLVNIDGSFKAISYESAKINQFIKNNQEFLMNSRVLDDGIAILYDIDSDLINRIENTGNPNDFNNFDLSTDFPYHYKKAVAGIYALFREAGLTCRVIDSRNLEQQLDGLQVIYVPQGLMLTDKTLGVLKQFADNGGTILAEEGITLRDSATWVRPQWPSSEARKMFGARIIERVNTDFRQESFITRNASIPASGYVSYLQVQGEVEIIGTWSSGKPAIVKNGRCLLIGTSLGASFHEHHDKAAEYLKVLTLLLENCKLSIKNNVPEGVYMRVLQSDDSRMIFLFNSTGNEQHIKLPANCKNIKSCTGLKLVPGQKITIPPRDIHAFRVDGNTHNDIISEPVKKQRKHLVKLEATC